MWIPLCSAIHSKNNYPPHRQKFKATNSIQNLPRSGRPTCISPDLAGSAIMEIRRTRKTTLGAVRESLKASGTIVGHSTVQRMLHANKLGGLQAKKNTPA